MAKKKVASRFLRALARSLAAYHQHGARSNQKLMPIHLCIADFVRDALGDGYSIASLGFGDGKEMSVAGKYYDKKVDIAVSKNGKALAAVGFKFVTSNYKQNNVNYFEGMLGETANLRRMGCGVAQVLALRKNMPYRAQSGEVERLEKINARNLAKYIRLCKDMDFPHKPDLLCVALVDFDEKGEARFCEADSDLDLPDDIVSMLQGELSVERFSEKFPFLCKIKE